MWCLRYLRLQKKLKEIAELRFAVSHSNIDKEDGHPTILGMKQIKDQVKALLIDKE